MSNSGVRSRQGTRKKTHALIVVGLLAALLLSNRPTSAAPSLKTEPGEISQLETHFLLHRPFGDDAEHPVEDTFLYGILGAGRSGFHTGVDIRSEMGEPIMAGVSGQIVYAGDDSSRLFGPIPNYYGNLVLLEAEQGYCPEVDTEGDTRVCSELPIFVLYAHLDETFVETGQRVEVGGILGTAGMTGIAMGPHLHLEVRVGVPYSIATVNPGLWLTPRPGYGVVAGRLQDASGDPITDDRVLVYRLEEEERLWRVVGTYPASYLIHSDYALGENFVLPDVPPGRYRVIAGHGAIAVGLSVTVSPDQMTFVDLTVPN